MLSSLLLKKSCLPKYKIKENINEIKSPFKHNVCYTLYLTCSQVDPVLCGTSQVSLWAHCPHQCISGVEDEDWPKGPSPLLLPRLSTLWAWKLLEIWVLAFSLRLKIVCSNSMKMKPTFFYSLKVTSIYMNILSYAI